MTKHRVDIATCRVLPEPDPDEEPLLDALATRDLDARLRAWNGDETSDPAPLTVIRSTWDYLRDIEGFRTWARELDSTRTLLNPYPVLLWNSHKRYLVDFAARGVSVVETRLLSSDPEEATRAVKDALAEWGRCVLKPAISAGSFETHLLEDAPEALIARVVAEREMMIQPYMQAVEDEGERSLVWIDGELTHSIRKSPRFAADTESVSDALPIDSAARAFASELLAPLGGALLYARVDVIRDTQTGAFRLMELELIEPSLFLIQHPPALERLADAIARAARDASARA